MEEHSDGTPGGTAQKAADFKGEASQQAFTAAIYTTRGLAGYILERLPHVS